MVADSQFALQHCVEAVIHGNGGLFVNCVTYIINTHVLMIAITASCTHYFLRYYGVGN